jgi:hypothetical protein
MMRRAGTHFKAWRDGSEKIDPVGIIFFYQGTFPIAPPAFEGFLAGDSHGIIAVLLVIDKFANPVSFGEPRNSSSLVFNDPANKVVGYAYIKSTLGFASENVDVKHERTNPLSSPP